MDNFVTVQCYVRKKGSSHELYLLHAGTQAYNKKLMDLCDAMITRINNEDTHLLKVELDMRSQELLHKWVFKSNMVTAKVYYDTKIAVIKCPFCGCEA